MEPTLNNKYLESYYPKVISEIKDFAIFMMDVNGVISTWNQGCEDLKGYASNEAIGKNYEILFPDFLRDENMPIKEIKEANRKGRYESENWRRKKSGELFWASVVLTKVTDEHGKHIGFVKITQDYSEKKKYADELKAKNEELKMINSDLDTFVYTASHDLKAPISNIESLTTALKDALPRQLKGLSEVSDLIELMVQSTLKFRATISDMAKSVKNDSGHELIYLSFKEVSDEVKDTLKMEIEKTEAIFREDYSEVPAIRYSRKNIRSILQNLITNSIKYRSPERRPVITIKTKKGEGHTLLQVSDNGLGIKEEDKEKAFSLYHRLEEGKHAEGTGVGLSIVAKIVDSNGGRIQIDSKPGEGTTFKLYMKI